MNFFDKEAGETWDRVVAQERKQSEIDAKFAQEAGETWDRVVAAGDSVSAMDYVKAAGLGMGDIASGAGWLAKKAGEMTGEITGGHPSLEVLGALMQFGSQKSNQETEESMTPAARIAMMKEYVHKDENGNYELGDADLNTFGLGLARSAPNIAAGMGVGGVATRGLAALGASKVPASVLGMGLGDSLVSSPMNGVQIEAEIEATPLHVLQDSVRYQEAFKKARGTEEQRHRAALESIKHDASVRGALQSAGTTFVASVIPGYMQAKKALAVGKEGVKASGKKALAVGAGIEGLQEFGQSGAEAVIGNLAVRDYADSRRKWDDGVLNASVSGLLSGTAVGGAMAIPDALTQRKIRKQQEMLREVKKKIEENKEVDVDSASDDQEDGIEPYLNAVRASEWASNVSDYQKQQAETPPPERQSWSEPVVNPYSNTGYQPPGAIKPWVYANEHADVEAAPTSMSREELAAREAAYNQGLDQDVDIDVPDDIPRTHKPPQMQSENQGQDFAARVNQQLNEQFGGNIDDYFEEDHPEGVSNEFLDLDSGSEERGSDQQPGGSTIDGLSQRPQERQKDDEGGLLAEESGVGWEEAESLGDAGDIEVDALVESPEQATSPLVEPEPESTLQKTEGGKTTLFSRKKENLSKTSSSKEAEQQAEIDGVKELDESERQRAAGISDSQYLLDVLARDVSPKVRAAVTHNSNASAQTLESLVNDENESVRTGIAKNPATPISILRKLDTSGKYVSRALASRKGITGDILDKIYPSNEQDVNNAVHHNPNLPADFIEKHGLLNNFTEEQIEVLAKREDASKKILKNIALRGSRMAKRYASANPNAPIDELLEMEHSDDSVLQGLIRNKNITRKQLLAIAEKDKWSLHAVANRIFMDEGIIDDLIKVLNTDPAKAKSFVGDKIPNRDLPRLYQHIEKVGNTKLKLKFKDYIYQIAGTKFIDEIFLNDGRYDLHKAATIDHLSPEDIQKIYKEGVKRSKKGELVMGPDFRKHIAEHRNTPPEILTLLAKDKNKEVRSGVAEHRNTPPEVIGKLMGDKSASVRDNALNNPNLPESAAINRLKELQKKPNSSIEEISALMESGKIPIASIKDASIKGVMRWRRELRPVREVVQAGETKLTQIASKSGLGKEKLNVLLNRAFDEEQVKQWRAKNQIDPEAFIQGMDSPEYQMLAMAKRESDTQSIAGHDHAISFFRDDLSDKFDKLYTTQVASGHPAGFGFVLVRLFDDNKSAVITEVQSDVMSVLFDKDKEGSAEGMLGDELADARAHLAPVRKTWPKALMRNAMRQLYDKGVENIYAITPNSMRHDLGANPPVSVVEAWTGEKAAKEEGFGEPVQLRIDRKKITAWDAITKGSQVAQDILFSRKADNPGSFKETEQRTGGKEAYERAKAKGKTKLNYKQWIQVRTPEFKAWFGDWELASSKVKRTASNILQARIQVAKFKNQTLENIATGMKATVSRNALDKMLSKSAMDKSASNKAHLVAVANLDALFEKALVGWSKPDRDNDRHIKAVTRLFAPMSLNNKVYLVKLTVKQIDNKGQGNRLYTVESLDVAEKSPVPEMVDADLGQKSDRPHRAIDSLVEQIQKYKPDEVSKVVDPDTGEPMVVYHGTPKAGFNTFREESYFTASKDYADRYQNPNASSQSHADKFNDLSPDTYAVFLNIRKPFDTNRTNEKRIFDDDFYRKWGNGSPLAKSGYPDWTDGADLLEFIDDNNYSYDGIIVDEGADGGYSESVSSRGLSYVPTKPNQIKSATDNNGEFNALDDNILKSKGPDKLKQSAKKTTKKPTTESVSSHLEQVKSWEKLLSKAFGVKARVVADVNGLPEAVKSELSQGDEIDGVYYDGKAYLVASEIHSFEDAVRVYLHEAVGHGAVLDLLEAQEANGGKSVLDVLDEIYNQSSRIAIERNIKRYDFDFSDPRQRREAVLEYIAHLAETGQKPNFVQRVIAALSGFFRQYFNIAWTDTDTLVLIDRAKRVNQERASNQSFSDMALSSKSNAERYREELKKTINSKRSTPPPVTVGRTPKVLQALGVEDLPLVILRDTVRKATNGIKHNVSMKVIEDLPSLINSPIAVFDSKTVDGSFVVLINAKDSDGSPVVAPIHINRKQGKLIVNKVASVFGYKNPITMGRKMNLRYLDAQKNPELVRHVGIQFPISGSPTQGSNKSVLTPDDIVNKPLKSLKRYIEEDKTLSAEQKAFLAGIGSEHVSFKERASERIAEITHRARTRIRQEVVDRHAGLMEMDKKLIDGDITSAENISKSTWIRARMTHVASGAVSAMMNAGRIHLDKEGVIDVKKDSQGLIYSLTKLGSAKEVERFFGWIVANRAEKLAKEDKEFLFSKKDIEAGKTLNQGKLDDGRERGKVYGDVFKEFQQHRNDVLAIAEKAGIIKPEDRKSWEDEFYVPFYRVFEESRQQPSFSVSKGGLTRQEAFKKLKGSKRKIQDPLHNTLMNFHHLIDASMKNMAAQQAIASAVALKVAKPLFPKQKTSSRNITYILKEGKRVRYEITDDLIFRSIEAISKTGLDFFGMKYMRGFKRLLTNMVTITPGFTVANLIRDSLSAISTSDLSYNAVNNVYSGFKDYGILNRNGYERARFLASGGGFSFGQVYGEDANAIKGSINRELKRGGVLRSKADMIRPIKAGWDFYRDLQDAVENTNRMAAFKQNREKGSLYAAFQARDIMDFSAGGASPVVRFIVETVPFINARIQGLDKLYRSGAKPTTKQVLSMLTTGKVDANITDKQAAKRFMMVIGALSFATIALYLHNMDNEEYKKLEEWDKDTYWHIFIGEHHFRLPKPFEVGAIATLFERMTEQMVDDEAGGELFRDSLLHMLGSTFSFNPTPQMFKPVLELGYNENWFTGRPIESLSQQGFGDPSLAVRHNTSVVAKTASKGMVTVFGKRALSPVQIDHLIYGYLGPVGAWVVSWADTAVNVMTDNPKPAKRWYEYQPISRFYKNTNNPSYTKYSTLFYDALSESAGIYKNVVEYRRLGEDAKADAEIIKNLPLWELRRRLNRKQKRIRIERKAIRDIRMDKSLSAEEKRRRINLTQMIINRIMEDEVKNLVERKNKIERKNKN